MNKSFEKYHDLHKGQRAIVFGTGPTYYKTEVDKLPKDCIYIGVNGCNARKDLKFDYYFFGDKLNVPRTATADYLKRWDSSLITKQAFAYTKVWLSRHEWKKEEPRKNLWLTDEEIKQYNALPYSITRQFVFRYDIVKFPPTSNIIFSAIQFAIYSGVREIFLVGSDVSPQPGLNTSVLLTQFRSLKKTLMPQTKTQIFSINPVGLKGIFPAV